MMRMLAALAVASLAAQEPKQPERISVSKTEHFEFPANGVLRLANSVGIVTVEGWDQPDVAMTTVLSTPVEIAPADQEKASRELDRVRVAGERHGDELVIRTDYPRHRGLASASPIGRSDGFYLEYRINVPRNARFVAGHGVGEVNVDGVLGDIRINAKQGQINLHLPEERQYAIDASSGYGSVNSDFPGKQTRKPWLVGHTFLGGGAGGSQNLHLRIGYGDIVILRVRKPAPPTPAS